MGNGIAFKESGFAFHVKKKLNLVLCPKHLIVLKSI